MLVKSGEAPAGPVGAAGAPALGGTDVAEVEMKQKVRPIKFNLQRYATLHAQAAANPPQTRE